MEGYIYEESDLHDPCGCTGPGRSTLAMLMRDENFLTDMSAAFDNRYRIGEIFEPIYVPEIDDFLKDS